MKNLEKSTAQLIDELVELRDRVAKLEALLKFRANSWKSRPRQLFHHSGQAKNVENVLFMRLLPTAER